MIPKIRLSPKGLEISQLVYGTMRIGEWGPNMTPKQVADLISYCIELGITTFDHADIYGNYSTEELFGKALALKPELKNQSQHVTKAGIQLLTDRRPNTHIKHYNTSKSYLISQAEASLKNLQIEIIDLFLVHRPDPLMDYSEIAEAFDELVGSGKVKSVGVSNFTPFQFEALNALYPLETNQVETSLLHTKPLFDGTFDVLQKNNRKAMIWSPFGGGELFTGSHYQDRMSVHETVNKMCNKYQIEKDQLLLAWILALPNSPAPIIGTTKKERIESAVKAFNSSLDRQDWFEMLRSVTGKDVD